MMMLMTTLMMLAPKSADALDERVAVEHILGEEVKLIWVETAHFRIGSSLEKWKVPRNKKEIRRRRIELRQKVAALPALEEKRRDFHLRTDVFCVPSQ